VSAMSAIANEVQVQHMAESVEPTDDYWYAIRCACGQVTEPVPTADIAVDVHTAHVVNILVETLQREGFM
jgi:hypothetical protein